MKEITKQQTAVKYQSSPRQNNIPRYTIPMNFYHLNSAGDDYTCTRANMAFFAPV